MHPAEFFLVILCGLSGVPYAIGVSRPHSLTALLPDVFVRGWGFALTFGALALMCGLTSVRYEHGREVVRRVPCYKLGLRLLAGAGTIYAIAIITVAGIGAAAAVAAVFLFVGYCLIRLLSLSVDEDRREDHSEVER